MSYDRRVTIIEFLRTSVSRRTGSDERCIDADATLTDLGLSSLDVTLISGDLGDHFGIEIDPVMMFECRTLGRIADQLTRTLEAA